MSQALDNAELAARRAEHHTRKGECERAIVELSKAVKELVSDNQRHHP